MYKILFWLNKVISHQIFAQIKRIHLFKNGLQYVIFNGILFNVHFH